MVLMPMEQQIWFLMCDALDVACCVILEVTLVTFATSVIDQTGSCDQSDRSYDQVDRGNYKAGIGQTG